MKTNKTVLATIIATLLVALPGYTTPRPNGHGQASAVHVQNGEQVSTALAASALAVDGVDGARLYQAMQSGKISQETLQRFLDPGLAEEFHPLCSQVIQTLVNLESSPDFARFSTTSSSSDADNIGSSLSRITELTIQKLNGQQTETSTTKMLAITEVINTYAQSAKTPIDAETAKQQAREILNADSEDPVVTPEQDPFELIKNCR